MLTTLNQFDLHHRLATTSGIAVVMFTSADCGNCRYFYSILQQLADIRPDWHLFTVDAQADMALTREFEIFHLPALFLYHAGHYHCALQAAASTTSILAAVDAALAAPAEEAP